MKTKKWVSLALATFVVSAGMLSAETDEPGPFERLFRALRHGFNEPQHRSNVHRTRPRQAHDTSTSSATTDESNVRTSTGSANKPPNEKNTRGTTKAATKKGDDLPYGTPVAGKQGFVTSPFSPNAGYIDVRGFSPGTPVKDPYSGKVFLTP
jgi:hypothetical protein